MIPNNHILSGSFQTVSAKQSSFTCPAVKLSGNSIESHQFVLLAGASFSYPFWTNPKSREYVTEVLRPEPL